MALCASSSSLVVAVCVLVGPIAGWLVGWPAGSRQVNEDMVGLPGGCEQGTPRWSLSTWIVMSRKKVPLGALATTFALFLTAPPTSAEAGDEVATAVLGGAVTAAAVAAYLKVVEEELEHFAVERILEIHPEMKQFQLSLVSFDVSSLLDLSTVRAVPCLVTPKGEDPFVFMLLFDSGWVTERGLDITRVSYREIDRATWNRLMGAVVVVAGGFETADLTKIPAFDRSGIRAFKLSGGESEREPTALVDYKQLRRISGRMAYFDSGSECLRTPLLDLGNDEYRVEAVQGLGRILYNERTVHLYLDEFGRLVRMKRKVIEQLQRGLFPSAGSCDTDDM